MNLFQPGTLLSTGVACSFEIAAGASATRTPVELAQALMTLLASGNGKFMNTEATVGKTITAAVGSVTSVTSVITSANTATADNDDITTSANLTSNLTECRSELLNYQRRETIILSILTVVSLMLLVLSCWNIWTVTRHVQTHRKEHDQALAGEEPHDHASTVTHSSITTTTQSAAITTRSTIVHTAASTLQESDSTSALTRVNRVQAAQLAFAKFDTDKSGTIDRTELGLLLAEWGISGVDEQLLQSFDQDGNGTFCFPEFVALFNSLGPKTGSAGIEYHVAI
jgi:hypothetical protein